MEVGTNHYDGKSVALTGSIVEGARMAAGRLKHFYFHYKYSTAKE
jgi:hypothetical protein